MLILLEAEKVVCQMNCKIMIKAIILPSAFWIHFDKTG